jgi:hypothetical protein
VKRSQRYHGPSIELRNGSNFEVLTPFRWPESNIMACVSGLHEMNLAQSETLRTRRRSLHGTGRPHPRPAWNSGPGHEGNSRSMGMNADEESDEGSVPMKRPNKEGFASAEDVEGRTSPKGRERRGPVRLWEHRTFAFAIPPMAVLRNPAWLPSGPFRPYRNRHADFRRRQFPAIRPSRAHKSWSRSRGS